MRCEENPKFNAPGRWIFGLDPNEERTKSATPGNGGREFSKEIGAAPDNVLLYQLFHLPTKIRFGVMIYVSKADEPEAIDPYTDCCALWFKDSIAKERLMRLTFRKPPTYDDLLPICRAGIAFHLESLGAWPPRWPRNEKFNG